MDQNSQARTVKLAAFVNYGNTEQNVHHVLINLSNKYFILYNYQAEFNSDTGDMGNQVTITKDSTADGGSDLITGLGVGDSWMTDDLIRVQVCSHEAGTPDVMVLSIGRTLVPCSGEGGSQGNNNNHTGQRPLRGLRRLKSWIQTVLTRAGILSQQSN
jgi:hypothetical protein